ncbi:MAG: SRPBCC family protein [Thermoanaerobaculia bacterium]
MSDRIEKTIELKAPIDRVWRALTDPGEFGTWFRVRLDGPFVVGEQTTGQITYEGYEHVRWVSRTTVMDEQRHHLAFTWVHFKDPANPQPDDPSTLVEFRLAPIAGGTRLELVESGFDAIGEDRRVGILRGNQQGWEMQMENIRAHVEE